MLETPAREAALSSGRVITENNFQIADSKTLPTEQGLSASDSDSDSLAFSLNDLPSDSILEDSAVLSAKKAFEKKHIQALDQLAAQTSLHPLHGYVQLWQLLLKLSKTQDNPATSQAFHDFIQAQGDSYLAERARGELARAAADTDNKALFHSLWPKLVWQNSEPDLRCNKAYIDLLTSNSEKNLSKAKNELITTPTPTADACKRLGTKVIQSDPDWIWSYLTVLTQQRRFHHVKRILSAFASKSTLQFSPSLAQDLYANPEAWYKKHNRQTKKFPVQLLVLAALRLAPIDEDKAANLAMHFSARLNNRAKTLIWGNIGFYAALNHNPKTLQYYRNAPLVLGAHPATVNAANQLQWQIRSALRIQSWSQVITLINRLPKPLAKDPCWVYWKARALIATKKSKEGRALLKDITNDPGFYGLLACDYLNLPYPKGLSKLPQPLSPALIAEFEANPHIRRALAFYEINLIYEGNREWNWALRSMNSNQRLLLSAYALKKGIIHRAINTSVSSKALFPALNYPLAYENWIRPLAAKAELPSAWIFGLIRQESRYIASAKSSAGALGLMQVMPKTAKWTAKQYELSDYEPSKLIEPETNIKIGTHYLKTVAENFDNSVVLSTASYNAGPSRSQQWRSTLLRPTEGAIFAETIPFNETREYVKQVTANMTHYSTAETPALRLTEILGLISPQEPSDTRIP